MLKYILPQDKPVSKELFTLAFPVILSNLSRVLMSVVDVAMVGRLGAAALAATGMGAMLFWGALPGYWYPDGSSDCCVQALGTEKI